MTHKHSSGSVHPTHPTELFRHQGKENPYEAGQTLPAKLCFPVEKKFPQVQTEDSAFRSTCCGR